MNDEDRTDYISVYEPLAGWKWIHVWFNVKDGGFWEPWDTSPYAFATKEEAIEEGRAYAASSGLRFVEST